METHGISTHQPTVLSEYLSDKDLASELDVSPRTLARWRRLNEGPPITRIGRKVTYRRSAVQSWLAGCERAVSE